MSKGREKRKPSIQQVALLNRSDDLRIPALEMSKGVVWEIFYGGHRDTPESGSQMAIMCRIFAN